MQGAEILDDGSVLKYMTESEIEEQRSSLLIMTQRHFLLYPSARLPLKCGRATKEWKESENTLPHLDFMRRLPSYGAIQMVYPLMLSYKNTLGLTAIS